MFMHHLKNSGLVVASLLSVILASACGVAGDKGLAIFHVGENWQKNVSIATGSTFAVTAEKNNLFHQALLASSALATVTQLPDGSFQAVQAGMAQFQALDPASKAVIDTVSFNVADPAVIALGAWWSIGGNQALKLAKKFALVKDGRYVGGIVLEDATGSRLNHAGITAVTCPGAQIKVVGQYVEATATTLGDTTATVTLTSGKGAALQTTYDVRVVAEADVSTLQLASFAVQNGHSAPADPDKAPISPDSGDAETNQKTQLFGLATTTALADGTPVYGAQIIWTESGTGHLLAKKTGGGNYAVLKSGETVTITATIGTLSKQVVLSAP